MGDHRPKYLAELVMQTMENPDRLFSRRLGEYLGHLLYESDPERLASALDELSDVSVSTRNQSVNEESAVAESDTIGNLLTWTICELLVSYRDRQIRQRVTDDLMALVRGKRGSDILLEMHANPDPANGWTPSLMTHVSEATSRSNISHLLRRFRAAGLVKCKKRGKNNVYTLTELGRQCAEQLKSDMEVENGRRQSYSSIGSAGRDAGADVEPTSDDSEKLQIVRQALNSGSGSLRMSQLPEALQQHFASRKPEKKVKVVAAIDVKKFLDQEQADSKLETDELILNAL